MAGYVGSIEKQTLGNNNFRQVLFTGKYASPSCSYDFVFLNMPKWTDKNQKEMEDMQHKTGIFLDPNLRYTHEDEYPLPFE